VRMPLGVDRILLGPVVERVAKLHRLLRRQINPDLAERVPGIALDQRTHTAKLSRPAVAGALQHCEPGSGPGGAQHLATYASHVEWLVAVGFFAGLAAIAAVLLSWRDRRRGPVCPWCGRPGTFAPREPDVCDNCGFDFRCDDY